MAVTLLDGTDTSATTEALNAGSLDVILAPASLRLMGHHRHIRLVAPLFTEALHLVVKADIAERAKLSLAALEEIRLGPHDSATAQLATAVLQFAGATPRESGGTLTLDDAALVTLLDRKDSALLPEALFVLQIVPSRLVARLVREHNYRLIPLQFAEAFRLQPLIAAQADAAAKDFISRHNIAETTIPAYTYRTDPPVPAAPMPTLGTRLLLLANERVADDTVELMLETIYSSHFAGLGHPALDSADMARPSHIPLHAGALAYVARDKPYISDDRVDVLSNALSIVGALGGSLLFLWQWRRQRTQGKRKRPLGTYMRQLANLERRTSELELSASLRLEPLAELQREILQLKSEVLEHVTAGDLDHAALPVLLTPLNGARDHVGNLLLHVRENIEEAAETQGRPAQALWAEAIDAGEAAGATQPSEEK